MDGPLLHFLAVLSFGLDCFDKGSPLFSFASAEGILTILQCFSLVEV